MKKEKIINCLKAFDKGITTFCNRIITVGLIFLAFDMFSKIALLGPVMHCLIIVILILACVEGILNGVTQYLKLKDLERNNQNYEK